LIEPAPHDSVKVLILSDVHLLGRGIETSLIGLPGVETTVKQPSERAITEIVAQERPDLIIVACERCYPHLLQRLFSSVQQRVRSTLICLSADKKDCPYGFAAMVLPLAEIEPVGLREVLQRTLGQVRDTDSSEGLDKDSLDDSTGLVVEPWQQKISEREREIGALVTAGYSSQKIAEKLFISQRTVEKHRANLMAKLGVSNAAALTRELMYLCWAEQGKFALVDDRKFRQVDRVEGRQVS